MTNAVDPSLDHFIDTFVRAEIMGDPECMDMIYAEDQASLVIDAQGSVARLSRAEMLEALRAAEANEAAPPALDYRVLHIEQQGSDAVVLLYRRRHARAAPVMSELRLRRYALSWLVTGETIMSWPGASLSAEAA